ncbi:MAG: aminotransferase class I/II-fold pyridoxal phosphate-dependent enzyme [Deltaproteobacteria bacterium]|nr:aminotransferase class I/II-fold pyridoxal phosphate-dependent enzyme [Deltaproteobacteria bacterium]
MTTSRDLVPPLVRSVTHRFESAAELDRYNRGELPGLFMYSRYENPTVDAAEKQLAQLQGTERGCLFASGMAAATTAILANLNQGDEVLAARNIYGGVHKFLAHVAPRWGISARLVDAASLSDPRSLKPNTKLVYFETPVNPTLRLVDAEPIVRAARAHGALTIVDSTFGPPGIQKLNELGVDLVMHSVTKYLNGHSDVLGGVVLGSEKHIEPIRKLRQVLGNNMDPAPAWELMRGLQTLDVRLARQQTTAHALAEKLSKDKRVAAVSYPGLTSHPDHALAKKQMRGFGAMVTFTVSGGLPAASRVFDNLQLIARAASLGSVESLCSLPVMSSHAALSPEELAAAGVDAGMVRISVGLESADALWADLDRALAKASA